MTLLRFENYEEIDDADNKTKDWVRAIFTSARLLYHQS